MTKTIKFQQVPFSHWPYPLSFGIRICFEFRVSIFGFCLNMTFRSGTKYPPPFVKGAGGISSDQRKPRIFPPFSLENAPLIYWFHYMHFHPALWRDSVMWVSWEIPPDPPFSKGGMFCCFRKLAGMRSFPACDPKIASEYLPLYQTPNTSPFAKP
jgi:hypothetical protein